MSELNNGKNNAVSFKGRIMNLDNQTINFLSKDVNKYLTWEANGKRVLEYVVIYLGAILKALLYF